MTHDDAADLEGLRIEIDRIDSEMAALLAARQEVSARIGRLKSGAVDVMRPGREAQIVRRLVDEVHGRVAADAILRLWREIFAASSREQAALTVAVCAPTGERPLWDLARDHFGGVTSLQRVDRPPQALRALLDDSAQVAVLPAPSDDQLWWTGLIEASPRLSVVARLPFGVRQRTEPADPLEALVVGRMQPDASGDDVSLLAINASANLSRGRLRELIAEAGLEAAGRAVARPPSGDDAWHLVEVAGFVEPDHAIMRELAREYPREVDRCVRVGAYARPLPLDDG